MEILHHYDQNHNVTSAKKVVPYIIEIIKPTSVVDVGCGIAQWLKVFIEEGVDDVLGIDGEHVPQDQLLISPDNFLIFDLRKVNNFNSKRRYDLCLSLEVAEHLEEKYAKDFVELLTRMSDCIIFSAAIPNQTGENHFNEQFPDYWECLFEAKGFVFLDPFREKFWEDEDINWWYRQNMYLVVKRELENTFKAKRRKNIYIHPDLLKLHINQNIELTNQIMNFNKKDFGLKKHLKRFLNKLIILDK